MERFDERLVVNEPSGSKFYQVVPCEDGKFVLYADAQATVEALQAQLQEGEVAYHKVGEYNDHLKQQVEALRRELEHAKKMEAVQKEVADNQTWHVQKLKGWRDTVTLALQRPGGARFEDVPGHIKALVKEHDTLRQLVEALPVAGLPVEHARSDDFVVLQANGEWMVHTYNYWAKFATEDEARAYIALLEYRASLPAQPAQGGAKCVWVDDGGDKYATGCNKYLQVYAESEEAQQWVKFCCYCGKPVEHFEAADVEGGA